MEGQPLMASGQKPMNRICDNNTLNSLSPNVNVNTLVVSKLPKSYLNYHSFPHPFVLLLET